MVPLSHGDDRQPQEVWGQHRPSAVGASVGCRGGADRLIRSTGGKQPVRHQGPASTPHSGMTAANRRDGTSSCQDPADARRLRWAERDRSPHTARHAPSPPHARESAGAGNPSAGVWARQGAGNRRAEPGIGLRGREVGRDQGFAHGRPRRMPGVPGEAHRVPILQACLHRRSLGAAPLGSLSGRVPHATLRVDHRRHEIAEVLRHSGRLRGVRETSRP